MSYLTFVPYVNRLDLLLRTLSSIECMWSKTVVIDNSDAKELETVKLPVVVCRPCVPLQFAQTMNLMQQFAVDGGTEYFFFMHADAEAEKDTAQKFLDLIPTLDKKWGVVFTNGDAFCCFRTSMVKDVGLWDWRGLQWYFSDKDYYYRIKIAGYEKIESNLPVVHTPSQTRASDPAIAIVVDAQLSAANAYYQLKWGGPRQGEIFLRPFNKDLAG